MLAQQPLLEGLARQVGCAHVDHHQAHRIAVARARDQDVFARDLARDHAEGHLLVGHDALVELVLAQRALDVVFVGIGDVGKAVPARAIVGRDALFRVAGQLAFVRHHRAVMGREEGRRAGRDAVHLVVAQHGRRRTARLVPGEFRAVHLAPVFVPVLEGEVRLAFERQRVRAPVREMHLVAVAAFRGAAVLRAFAARGSVDAAHKGRRHDQGFARGRVGGAQGWAVLVVGAVEIGGHGMLSRGWNPDNTRAAGGARFATSPIAALRQ